METKAKYLLVGTCTILAVLLFAGFLIFSKAKDTKTTLYAVYFKDGVRGLSAGNSVLFNGVPVGAVKEIGLAEENQSQVRVVLEISSSVIIRQDCKASLDVQGITGMSSIYISGGSSDSPPLDLNIGKDKDAFPVIPEAKSTLSSLASEIPEMITSATHLINGMTKAFSDENTENLRLTMEAMAKISTSLAEESGTLHETLASLKSASAQMNRLLTDADQMMTGDIRKTVLSVQRSFDNLNKLINELEPELTRISGSGSGSLNQLLQDTRTLVRNLDVLVRDLNANPRSFIFGPDVPEYEPR